MRKDQSQDVTSMFGSPNERVLNKKQSHQESLYTIPYPRIFPPRPVTLSDLNLTCLMPADNRIY